MKYRFIRSITMSLVVMALLYPNITCASPHQNFYFKTIGVEDGLSQSMVYDILQDRHGFMWFATQDGLNRYDGDSFRVYQKDLKKVNYLKSDAIFSLAEDRDGILWIGTDNGVYLYDMVSDSFKSLSLKTKDGVSINGIVRDIILDKNGDVWLAVSDQGVFCVKGKSELIMYSFYNYFTDGRGMIRNICFDFDDNLWIATYQNGIYKLDVSTGDLQQFLIDNIIANISDNDVNAVCMLNNETLLVGTVNKGLLKLNLRDYSFSTLMDRAEDGGNLFIRNIYIDNDDKVWLGTETGIYIYSPTDQSRIHLQHTFNDPYSLSDNAIHSIYQDREEGIWIGSYFGGVNYFAKSHSIFEKHYPSVKDKSINGKSISEFCEDASGNIWVGTEDAGLHCFDPITKQFSTDFIPASNIHALLHEDNKLWIGSFSEGLFTIDLEDYTVQNYKSSSIEGALHCDDIYSIYKDFQESIWIGTRTGLYRYTSETDRFESIRPKEITSQVNAILEDFYGVLWFATVGQGLFSYDRKQNKWEHYPTPVHEDLARGKMVICLHEDSKHGLWIGTKGAGLVHYDRSTNSFTKYYNVSNGLPNDVIYQILEDRNGNIWGSTNKGLFSLNPLTESVKTYTHSDGLLGDQFNYKSGFVSEAGMMYFGGIKGFVAFDPSKLTSYKAPSKVVFNSFYLYNKEVSVGEKDSPLKQHITHTQEITLSHKQHTFSIGFVALCYSSPQRHQYLYKLEGWDTDWIESGQSHRAIYSNLTPGDYTFYAKAISTDGLWEDIQAIIDIRILPPFYQTIWAYFFYMIICVILIYYGVSKYINRFKKRNLEIIKLLESKRERELYDAKINFFTFMTHEIMTPLSLIHAPLEVIMQKIEKSDTHYENLSIIQRNTNRLLKLVKELLVFRRAEADGLRLNFISTNIIQLSKDTIMRFTPSAHIKNVTFKDNFTELCFIADIDIEVFTKILSNLLNNALKYSDTYINVELHVENDEFRLSVSNDGKCIPYEDVERIFNPFVTLGENNQGTGIGLAFTKTLVEAHRGQIYVDTNQPDVTFVIVLPRRQEISIIVAEDPLNSITEDEYDFLESDITSNHAERRKVILSVEDNEEFQNFMTNQLTAHYQIIKAKNGEHALSLLDEFSVDLIISDIMMPVMDGMTLCKRIKEDIKYSHIPIIILSAKIELQSQIDGLKIGADEYIVKPFSVEFLNVRIENLLLNRQKILNYYKQSPESNLDTIAHSKADKDFLDRLFEVINHHLDEIDLDVDKLAYMMNMSRATLYRKVKNISELTPNDFIRLIRLKRAATLLNEREYRVNEIAFIVGFNSSSYFSKCFYKQFGVLPKNFNK